MAGNKYRVQCFHMVEYLMIMSAAIDRDDCQLLYVLKKRYIRKNFKLSSILQPHDHPLCQKRVTSIVFPFGAI